jgi:hypothetical protein
MRTCLTEKAQIPAKNTKKRRIKMGIIKDWIIEPVEEGLWRAEIIADAETINKIEDICQEITEETKDDKSNS